MWDFYGGRPGGSFLVFSAWPTPDLRELDFGRIGHPPLMFRSPGPVPRRTDRRLRDPAGHRRRDRPRLGGRAGARLSRARHCSRSSPAASSPPAPWPHHAGGTGWATWPGEAVGTASAFVGDHHVDVEFISTLESARGRGIGRALTATATRRRAGPCRRCSSRAIPAARSTSDSDTFRCCGSRSGPATADPRLPRPSTREVSAP